MSKMFFEGEVPESETTEGMVLVYNRTETPKTVTTNGHVLGGKEKAWVTWDDPVLMSGINSEIFRIIKTRYARSARVGGSEQTAPMQTAKQPMSTSNSSNQRKRKSKP